MKRAQPSTDVCINKMWHLYNGLSLSHKKEGKILTQAATLLSLKDIMLNERSRIQKYKRYMSPLT